MATKINIFLILTFLATVLAVKKNYDGYKVYKVTPTTESQVAILKSIEELGIGEFWEAQIVLNAKHKVMISKENQDVFLKRMKNAQFEAIEVISDLLKLIDDQLKPSPKSRSERENFHSMTWDRYYPLDEIYKWLDELETAYPNIVSTVNWGRSNEGREMKGIIINHHPERENKLIGVIQGVLHAREWITTATLTWVVKEFLSSTNPEVRAFAENFEWHILPVANPDGYVYSFTDNRMWRKNRNTVYGTNCSAGIDDDMSNGVDLNRNFDFQWMTIGASADPCTNTFAGSAGASEPETRVIVNYLQNLRNDGEIIYYLDFHSYTQLVVIPYSHLTSADDVLQAENYADMFEIGARAAARLEQRFGTQYRVGTSSEVLYPMSGTGFDWVKHNLEVPVSYLLEFRDLGEYGFLLPPDQIIPNSLEVMDFLLEMDSTTRILGYYRSGTPTILCPSVMIILGLVLHCL